MSLKHTDKERHKLEIKSHGTKTVIRPSTEMGERLAATINDVAHKGAPTNEDIKLLGDKFKEILLETRPSSLKAKHIENDMYNLISDIQKLMLERNYDERLQDALKRFDKAAAESKIDKGDREQLGKHLNRLSQLVKELIPKSMKLMRRVSRDEDFRELLISYLDIFQEKRKKSKQTGESKSEKGTEKLKDVMKSDEKTSKKASKLLKEPVKKAKEKMGGAKSKTSKGGEKPKYSKTTKVPSQGVYSQKTTQGTISSGMPQSNVGVSGQIQGEPSTYGTTQKGYLTPEEIGVQSMEGVVQSDESEKEYIDRYLSNEGYAYIYEETSSEVSEEDLPSEKREDQQKKEEVKQKTIDLIQQFRKHHEYPGFLHSLLSIYDEAIYIVSKLGKTKKKGGDKHRIRAALEDLRVFTERLCDTSLYNWVSHLKSLSAIQNDPLYAKMRGDMEQILFDPHQKYQTNEEIRDYIRDIKENMKELNNKYDNLVNNFLNETKMILKGFRKDEYLISLAHDWTHLVQSTFTDENGRPNLRVALDSFDQLQKTFFPVIKEQLTHRTLPSFDIYTHTYTLKVDDLYTDLSDLLPDQFKMKTESVSSLDRKKDLAEISSKVSFLLDNIDFKMEEVSFYFKKKSGFKYEDYGVVDINVNNAYIEMNFNLVLEDNSYFRLDIHSVTVDIHKLNIKIHEAKHKFLDKIITTLFKNTIRKRINVALAENILKVSYKTCGVLNTAMKRAAKNTGRYKRYHHHSSKKKKELPSRYSRSSKHRTTKAH